MARRSLIGSIALVWVLSVGVPALALFTGATTIGSNTFTTATLQPPTGLTATPSCDGANAAKASLDWTATTSTFADGYDVYRSTTSGGPYTNVAHVSGRSTVSYMNAGLSTNTTYYYVLQATANNWTSVNSVQASAATPASC